MTVVVAAMGFFLVRLTPAVCCDDLDRVLRKIQIPDAPGMARVFWMSRTDDQISRYRLDRVKKLPPTVSYWR